MTLRTWRLWAAIAVAAINLAVPVRALAQTDPPPAASAVADGLAVTPGTACGAPGVGRVDGRGVEKGQRPGRRVDESGRWVDCDRACEPARPEAFRTWSQGDAVCTTYSRYASSPTHPARDRGLVHGELGRWEQWQGAMRGALTELCLDGQRKVLAATCAPATHCATVWARDGLVYDGRQRAAAVPLGGFATATSSDGRSVRIQCVAGDWMATPQCQPGQEVTRTYTWQRRVYRYSGPPVDVGARVRAEQVYALDTRSGASEPGANRIRWTVATCGPGGVLR